MAKLRLPEDFQRSSHKTPPFRCLSDQGVTNRTQNPDSPADTKNPGSRAGEAGVNNGSAWRLERQKTYTTVVPRSSDFDLAAWAIACDSAFESMERNARVGAALRVLNELLPDDARAGLWEQAVAA